MDIGGLSCYNTILSNMAVTMIAALALLSVMVQSQSAPAAPLRSDQKVEGYLEFVKGDFLIVDAQRVRLGPGGRLKVKDVPSATIADIPKGSEIEAKGTRAPDGTFLAAVIEAKPNGSSFGEGDMLTKSTQAEKAFTQSDAVSELGANGQTLEVGQLWVAGPEWERARGIVDSLLPSYVDPREVRVYVVNNPEWNAMAMPNFSLYVYSGLMTDLDDDELAIVLGHEVAHATHEHGRRGLKKSLLGGMGVAVIGSIASKVTKHKMDTSLQLLMSIGGGAFSNKFSRDYEDQADRVGLRYVYEAGYDYTKGPALWRKFAKKYGDQNKFSNFLFGDHSISTARASHLENEIQNNYIGVADPPLRSARPSLAVNAQAIRVTPSGNRGREPARALADLQGLGLRGLTASESGLGSGVSSRSGGQALGAAPIQTVRQELRPGMTPLEVIEVMGKPLKETSFGKASRWEYAEMIVKFDSGRVTTVDFK